VRHHFDERGEKGDADIGDFCGFLGAHRGFGGRFGLGELES
jgi:hypothetical protein